MSKVIGEKRYLYPLPPARSFFLPFVPHAAQQMMPPVSICSGFPSRHTNPFFSMRVSILLNGDICPACRYAHDQESSSPPPEWDLLAHQARLIHKEISTMSSLFTHKISPPHLPTISRRRVLARGSSLHAQAAPPRHVRWSRLASGYPPAPSMTLVLPTQRPCSLMALYSSLGARMHQNGS